MKMKRVTIILVVLMVMGGGGGGRSGGQHPGPLFFFFSLGNRNVEQLKQVSDVKLSKIPPFAATGAMARFKYVYVKAE